MTYNTVLLENVGMGCPKIRGSMFPQGLSGRWSDEIKSTLRIWTKGYTGTDLSKGRCRFVHLNVEVGIPMATAKRRESALTS